MATISEGLRRLAVGSHNLDFVPVTNGRLLQTADVIDALVEALEFYADQSMWDNYEYDQSARYRDRDIGSELGGDKGEKARAALSLARGDS